MDSGRNPTLQATKRKIMKLSPKGIRAMMMTMMMIMMTVIIIIIIIITVIITTSGQSNLT